MCVLRDGREVAERGEQIGPDIVLFQTSRPMRVQRHLFSPRGASPHTLSRCTHVKLFFFFIS